MQLVHIFPTKTKVYEIFYSPRDIDDHFIKIDGKTVWNKYGEKNALVEVIRLMTLEINGEPNE